MLGCLLRPCAAGGGLVPALRDALDDREAVAARFAARSRAAAMRRSTSSGSSPWASIASSREIRPICRSRRTPLRSFSGSTHGHAGVIHFVRW
jgi:hypothetical protein